MGITRLSKAVLYTVIFFLFTSCNWFVKKGGEVNRSLLMYMAVTSNLSTSINVNLSDVKNSPFVPEYFDIKKGSGDVLLVMEHREKDIPRLKRFYRNEFGEVVEEILQEYEGRSSIEPELLHEVLVYANTIFPAKESGILFSSHGTGWIPDGYYANPSAVKSFGQIDKKEMDVKDMAAAIPDKYSYIIMDACLMGSVEVAYEMKEKGEYMLLSPTEIMAAGFPYGDVIEQVFYAEGDVQSRLSSIAASYYEFYTDESSGGGTISLIKSSELAGLADAVRNIISADGDKIATLNMSKLQPYFRGSIRHWFYDLTDFMENISSDSNRLAMYKAAVDKAVVTKYATDKFLSIPIRTYSGLSTYIPKPANSYLDSYYRTLAWNEAVQILE